MRQFRPSTFDPYQSAVSHIRMYRKNQTEIQIQYNTILRLDDWNNSASVRFHSTDIVTYYQDMPGIAKINTGGWNTMTTKQRIAEYSRLRLFTHRTWGLSVPNDDRTPIRDRKCQCCHGHAPEFKTTLGRLAGLKCHCGEYRKWHGDNYDCRQCRDTGYVQIGGKMIGVPFTDGMLWNMRTGELVDE